MVKNHVAEVDSCAKGSLQFMESSTYGYSETEDAPQFQYNSGHIIGRRPILRKKSPTTLEQIPEFRAQSSLRSGRARILRELTTGNMQHQEGTYKASVMKWTRIREKLL